MNARIKPSLLIVLWLAFVASGCQNLRPTRVAETKAQQTHENCFSLLHDLLSQQKNVDKLLLVKKESDEVRRLIKSIAAASAAGAKRLESFAQDGSLKLDQLLLPPGEAETREAIARTKTKTLLTPFNPGFELNLLLTQTEALSYGWHLAEVASKNDQHTDRSRYLSQLGNDMKALYEQTMALLRSRMVKRNAMAR